MFIFVSITAIFFVFTVSLIVKGICLLQWPASERLHGGRVRRPHGDRSVPAITRRHRRRRRRSPHPAERRADGQQQSDGQRDGRPAVHQPQRYPPVYITERYTVKQPQRYPPVYITERYTVKQPQRYPLSI